MALNITNLYYSEQDIGATLKISKRQYIWEFDLNGSSQRIELLDSRLSHKKRLFKNGVNILKTTEDGNFIHNFEIDGHPCVIIQYGDKIELRIDNQSFTHLYNLQKNKQLFAGEKGPTSNIYVAKPYNSYGSSDNKNNNESAFYKVNKPEEENKPKLFNFEIKKDSGNKSQGFGKFKFGQNKDKPSFNSNTNNNNMQNNNNNNKGNIDLLGMQNSGLNENNNMNNNNNNNNLLDFGQNNTGNNNQNVQNPQKSGNDIFDLFGNNNNNINNKNDNNNNNPYNNIFLQISDGTNQQPNFDQNNLGFLNLGNNMNNNMPNNAGNMMMNNNQNNNIFNGQNNNNNNSQNQTNNAANIDLLNF